MAACRVTLLFDFFLPQHCEKVAGTYEWYFDILCMAGWVLGTLKPHLL